MRKTSQDGGDSTSITSGIENELKKVGVGIMKAKRNSIKKKVQSFSHESDDGVIEPLLHKNKEKTEVGNQSAKFLMSKAKTDSSSNKGNDMDKLLADSKIDKPSITIIPGITENASLGNGVKDSYSIKSFANASIHNHMNTNVFSTQELIKGIVAPKSQTLVAIDGSRHSGYNPSPLIFTTAKIHTDGKTKHMEPVQVTSVPILSTIEGNVVNAGPIKEYENESSRKDNNSSISYEKSGLIDIQILKMHQVPMANSAISNTSDLDASGRLTTASCSNAKVNNSTTGTAITSNTISEILNAQYTKTSLGDSNTRITVAMTDKSNTAVTKDNNIDINKNDKTTHNIDLEKVQMSKEMKTSSHVLEVVDKDSKLSRTITNSSNKLQRQKNSAIENSSESSLVENISTANQSSISNSSVDGNIQIKDAISSQKNNINNCKVTNSSIEQKSSTKSTISVITLIPTVTTSMTKFKSISDVDSKPSIISGISKTGKATPKQDMAPTSSVKLQSTPNIKPTCSISSTIMKTPIPLEMKPTQQMLPTTATKTSITSTIKSISTCTTVPTTAAKISTAVTSKSSITPGNILSTIETKAPTNPSLKSTSLLNAGLSTSSATSSIKITSTPTSGLSTATKTTTVSTVKSTQIPSTVSPVTTTKSSVTVKSVSTVSTGISKTAAESSKIKTTMSSSPKTAVKPSPATTSKLTSTPINIPPTTITKITPVSTPTSIVTTVTLSTAAKTSTVSTIKGAQLPCVKILTTAKPSTISTVKSTPTTSTKTSGSASKTSIIGSTPTTILSQTTVKMPTSSSVKTSSASETPQTSRNPAAVLASSSTVSTIATKPSTVKVVTPTNVSKIITSIKPDIHVTTTIAGKSVSGKKPDVNTSEEEKNTKA